MTSGINREAVVRRRAAELLGVPEDASSVEVRRAYFKRVRESDFVPQRSLRHALGILEGKSASVGIDEEMLLAGRPASAELEEELLLEEESRLRAEVESFAEKFFTFPVAARREHWGALLSKCQNVPQLTARLHALKAGLEVETLSLSLDQSFRGRLAEHLLQGFPLLPLARAESRQAFLRVLEERPDAVYYKYWEKAARSLRAGWPAVAGLDQELVRDIAKLRRRLKRRSKTHQRSRQQQYRALTTNRKGTPWWAFLIVFGLLSGLSRTFTTSPSSSLSRPSTPNPNFPNNGVGLKDSDKPRLPLFSEPSKGEFRLIPSNRKPVDSVPRTPPGGGGPKSPKPSQADKPRP
jgi:hypothetical protein